MATDKNIVQSTVPSLDSYTTGALIVTNLLVALVVVNALLGLAFFMLDVATTHQEAVRGGGVSSGRSLFNPDGSPTNTGKRTSYQLDWFDYLAYENIEQSYAAEVLDDFYQLAKLGFIYQPWVQFSEPPFQGKRVTVDVDDKGFPIRRTINPPNAQDLPTIRIFTLGGSTTFGYNVSDEHTWPSHLSSILNDQARRIGLNAYIEVINYGRGFYYPSQETALATDLTKLVHRPHLMIFMDGGNPGVDEDVPWFTEKLGRQMEDLQFARSAAIVDQLKWVPMVRLALAIQHRLLDTKTDAQQLKRAPYTGNPVELLTNRFLQNREISKAVLNYYDVKSLFFLQPDATYNYSLRLYRRPLPESALLNRKERAEFYEHDSLPKGAILLSNLFELWGTDRKAIVDDCHYSPHFNRFLAEHVASHIDLESLLLHPNKNNGLAPTGFPRMASNTSHTSNRQLVQ